MRWKRQRRSGLKIKRRNKCLALILLWVRKASPCPSQRGRGMNNKNGAGETEVHRLRCISWAYNVKCVGMTRLELATTRPPDVYANQLRYIPWLCTMYYVQFTMYNLQCTMYNWQLAMYYVQVPMYYVLFAMYYVQLTILHVSSAIAVQRYEK